MSASVPQRGQAARLNGIPEDLRVALTAARQKRGWSQAELLLVPRSLAPVVQSMIRDRHRPDSNATDEGERPLYASTGEHEGDEACTGKGHGPVFTGHRWFTFCKLRPRCA